MSRWSWLLRSIAFLASGLLLGPASQASEPTFQELRAQAQTHERGFEWDKALNIYGALLREQNNPELQDRYQLCLRRYWQTLRHQDESYRKEVLSLDYGQALRLYNRIRDTLLDNALDRKRVEPGRLLQRGIEELDAALAQPGFCQLHLPGKQAEALAFRDYLKRKFVSREPLTRAQVEKQIREIALAAQDMLQLNTTVTIMELACGANYAIDNYTAYLTPQQFHDLCEALKGDAPSGMIATSVLAGLDLPSMSPRVSASGVGYLRILHFQETTLQELDAALDTLAKSSVKGLVLDLRGNPGGLVDVAVETARRFLATGIIATIENQDPRFSTVHQARGPAPCTLPLAVLVDGDTASAAELLAGALKENDRARLFGQTTFGKGCTQSLVKLPAANGVPTGGLRVTVARFFSPKGNAYTGRGVAPDVIVGRTKPDMMDMIDYQLSEAVADLQRQWGMR